MPRCAASSSEIGNVPPELDKLPEVEAPSDEAALHATVVVMTGFGMTLCRQESADLVEDEHTEELPKPPHEWLHEDGLET